MSIMLCNNQHNISVSNTISEASISEASISVSNTISKASISEANISEANISEANRMNEPRQKRSYKPTGNARIGRPTDKTQAEIVANKRRLERDYSIRRGRFITKINYYEGRYDIPTELKILTQETDEELKFKCKTIIDYVKSLKWGELMEKSK